MFADKKQDSAERDDSLPMSDMTQEFDRADRWRAFAIHLFTASGAFMAFLSLIAAAEQRWVAMFAWLGLALFVDGIDGPMARKVNVKGVLPNWSGDLLDSIIDYATYSLIPAVALYLSGMIGRPGKCPWKCGSFMLTFLIPSAEEKPSISTTRSTSRKG